MPLAHRSGRGTVYAWVMWSMTASFVLFQFFLQLTSGEMVTGLMHSFSLSAFGGGVLASMYYYIYVTLQAPAGLLIDRFGPRRLLSLGAVVCGLGSLLFGLSQHLPLAIVGRLMMGAGAAFAFVGSLNVIAKWFPPHRFALMAAIAETVGMLGSVFGGFFLAELVLTVGWRHAMIDAAGILAIIAALIWIVVRDIPPKSVPWASLLIPVQSSFKADLKALIGNRFAWMNGLYSGLMFSIVSVFVALWGVPYFQLAHHMSLMMATVSCNLMFIGVAVGGPIFGWLDSQIVHRRLLLGICALLSAALISVLIFVTSLSLFGVMGCMILLGLFASAYVLTFAIAGEIVPPHQRGTSLGFTNMLSVGTAPILQPLVGLIMHLVAKHSGSLSDQYTVHDYQMALMVIPALVVVSAILVRWIPNRRAVKDF